MELLTDTNYVMINFTHGEFTQGVYALNTASTDFDLTGQVIWQAANIMGAWLVEEHLPHFENATILELGAGPGLAGVIAA